MDSTQPQPQHTNRQYEEDLRGLRAGLLKMGGLVERQIAEAVDALVNRDSDHAPRSHPARRRSEPHG